MKIWITKYALTDGIVEKEAKGLNGRLKVEDGLFPWYLSPKDEGKNWHRTKESAIARAEVMRNKKIASLKKQIEKLENMKFE